MIEFLIGALITVGLLVYFHSSSHKDRQMNVSRGVSIEGLANRFLAVLQSLERDSQYLVDRKALYAEVVQQVVRRNAPGSWDGVNRNIPDDFGTKLVSDLAGIYKDSLQFRIVVEWAISYCVKDIQSLYSSDYGQYISDEYIKKRVARVIPEHY